MDNSSWLFGLHHYILAEATENDMHYDLIEKDQSQGYKRPEEMTDVGMVALPGSLAVGRMQGEEYFKKILTNLKDRLTIN